MDVTSYLLGKKAGGGGETPVLINKNINANGTYNASSDSADGYKKVVVDVQPNLETKSITITENKTTLIEPTQGKDGMSSVSVITNVPQSGGRDWSAIGYSSEPQLIIDGYNYAKDIYDNWDASQTNLNQKYKNDKQLVYMPLVDTSNVTTMSSLFNYCDLLQNVPLLNTSNVTTMSGLFSGCSILKEVPQLDTSKVTTASNMFDKCTNLKTIPLLDFSSATNILSIFGSLPSLTTLGGFKDLGKAYSTTRSAGYNSYKLDLTSSTLLTHDSLMNVINNLYDIATKGCNAQDLNFGSTLLAKLTQEEIAIATNKGWTMW